MGQADLLKAVVTALEESSVRYLVTGSMASSLLGEPRPSHDLDLVVHLPEGAAARLGERFGPPTYHLDVAAAEEARKAGTMFNLLDVQEGDKVDFWMLTGEPFDRSRMARRIRISSLGMSLWLSSPEDTILAKLSWARKSGGSERQLRDALGVYEVQRRKLDEAYLGEWAGQLGVTDLWFDLKSQARAS